MHECWRLNWLCVLNDVNLSWFLIFRGDFGKEFSGKAYQVSVISRTKDENWDKTDLKMGVDTT